MRKYVRKKELEALMGIEENGIRYELFDELFKIPVEHLFKVLSEEAKIPGIREDGRYVMDLLKNTEKCNSGITYGEAVNLFLAKKGNPSPADYKAARILLYKIYIGRSESNE